MPCANVDFRGIEVPNGMALNHPQKPLAALRQLTPTERSRNHCEQPQDTATP